ncbi:MAG: ATP-dependent zinc metalloprotease FtsH [Nevskia sp.]|nr:ATP-dependent zinc metalloprotease FtsH [Nevskia sp.]
MDEKSNKQNLLLPLAIFLAVLAAQYYVWHSAGPREIPYSEFEQDLKDGKLSQVVVTEDNLRGVLKGAGADQRQVVATRVDPQLAAHLDSFHVPYQAEKPNPLIGTLVSWVAPFVVLYLLWSLVFRRFAEKQGLGGGLMAIGKSKAKVYVETDTRVSFADVAGVDEAKAELQEIVAFLKDPMRYGRLGALLPRGVLLVGPPGTGKTLLARAVAGEAGVPFLSINGSEFVEMFVGVGAARVRDLFEQARAKAPAIVFIDELDALGKARSAFPMGGQDEKEQTLNQLLSEMDGFDPKTGLMVLAATNRPEILDQALLRAGRFDRQVLVDRPDRKGRVQILQVHARKVPLAAAVDLDQVAAMTPGFSGADLANLVNEAAIFATRRGADCVTADDFTQALERIVAGIEKRGRLLNPRERRVVAYHELGHAFVSLALMRDTAVQKVSLIPRGIGSLGYTLQRPTEDRYLVLRSELESRMSALLGGRAAELLVYEEASTGAADDLVKASAIARDMVMRFGLSGEIGPVVYAEESLSYLGGPTATRAEKPCSEHVAEQIDAAVRRLLDEALARATEVLRQRRANLEIAVEVLLQRETLQEPELQALFDGAAAGAPAPAPPATSGKVAAVA